MNEEFDLTKFEDIIPKFKEMEEREEKRIKHLQILNEIRKRENK